MAGLRQGFPSARKRAASQPRGTINCAGCSGAEAHAGCEKIYGPIAPRTTVILGFRI
jgi:hypothetical protein